VCPNCKGRIFTAKYEASYVYSYVVDSDAPGIKNHKELLPYLFDNREQKDAKQYVECNGCGMQYPCFFDKDNWGPDFTLFQNTE